MGEAVIVSACLAGIRCRYDGGDSLTRDLLDDLDNCTLVPLCPEQLGGLATPREPSEITEGDGCDVLAGRSRVVTESGADVTANFLKGAWEALRAAGIAGATRAFLKEKSPSCGVNVIKRNGQDTEGCGLFAALLSREKFDITGV